jgi:hypothetical protein
MRQPVSYGVRRLAAIAGAVAIGVAGNAPSPALAAPGGSVSINDVSVAEGDSGVKLFSFTVQAKGKVAASASVAYATSDGTASSPADYDSSSGTISFASGKRQKVVVPVRGDAFNEADETFFVTLSNPIRATIGDNQGRGTILDDDALPSVSINDVTVGEGNIGTATASFTVSLSHPSGASVTANYATANGSAQAGSDYDAASGTLTFAPGDVTKTVDVTINGDGVSEGDENFTIALSNWQGAALADGSGRGTIVDDEGAPAISVDDVTLDEGDSGTKTATFTVTLSHLSVLPVTVDYATEEASASAPGDFTATGSTLSFGGADTTKTIDVTVEGDELDEPNEVFRLNLSNPSNAVLADGVGSGSISDDDPQPSVSIDNVSVTEGNSGTKSASFQITLSRASGRSVTVTYETANQSAVAPADYAAKSATTTLSPGDTGNTIDVTVVGDTAYEQDETFDLNISAVTHSSLGDAHGVGTIANDGDRNPSRTTVRKAIRRGQIRVNGVVSPAHSGSQMAVRLLKKKDGRFVSVRVKRPSLGSGVDVNKDGVLDSRYKTSFANPRRTRRCRVVATFPGDQDHRRSRARSTFDC